MGVVLLLIAVCAEIALLGYCLVTKSHQEKARNIITILAFIAFSILVLTSVIRWGFRWIGLTLLLFFGAADGFWRLLHPEKQQSETPIRLIVTRTMISLLLVFLAISPAILFPPYEPLAVTGPYRIGNMLYTYTDEDRTEQSSSSGEKRRVNLTCWFPENTDGDETYPLVVFSHGGLGTENSNMTLYRELASNGYVVCALGHPYHAFWTRDEDGRLTFVSMEYFRQLQQEDAQIDKQQSFRYYQEWMKIRTDDINFVLDTIIAHAANGDDSMYRRVDYMKIGVMGHSLGGSAALAIPRLRDDIDAVTALESPFLYDIIGVENDDFVWLSQPFLVPVLNIYSDSSWSHLSEWPQYARNDALLFDAPPTAVSLYLPGRGHFSLTDLSLVSPLLVRLLDGGKPSRNSVEYLKAMNNACLDFFDRYLKGLDRQ